MTTAVISNSNLRFYVNELQISQMLSSQETAFLNFLYDCYIVHGKQLQKSDLTSLNELYLDVQTRKGYGHA
jgi:hypothetical protein